jgi:hypothetical protein
LPLRGMLVPGYACTSQIWEPIFDELGFYDLTLVDWPVEQTPGFHHLDDFAGWLGAAYWPGEYDFLIGHSMSGLVALRLAAADLGEKIQAEDGFANAVEIIRGLDKKYRQNVHFKPSALHHHLRIEPRLEEVTAYLRLRSQ